MFIDLHVHTNRYSSCSVLSPEEMINRAIFLKLDGLVIVEHELQWDMDEIVSLKKFCREQDFLILRGQEIRTRYNGRLAGDILVFGVDYIIDNIVNPKELIEIVKGEGGVCVAAHPYRPDYGLGDDVYNLDLDGIEILNGNTSAQGMQLALEAQQNLQIAGTGGSDAHCADAIGKYLTYFPEKIATEADLAAAIRGKKCRPAYYNELLMQIED